MRPKRSFWAGLGVGMMSGALLLQLVLTGQSQSSGLMEEAAPGDTLGISGTDAVYTQEEADLLVKSAVDKAKQELAAQEQPTGKQEQGQGQSSGNLPAKQNSGEDGASPAASKDKKGSPDKSAAEVVLRIPPNSNLTDIGKILEAKGIIEDGDGFVAYMQLKGSSGSVRAGYFRFQGSPKLAEIRKIVTSPPMKPEEAKKKMGAGG